MKSWIKCLIGLHLWIYDRELTHNDTFPYPMESYSNPMRECKHCKKRQYWLPGYGGSELGSWEAVEGGK